MAEDKQVDIVGRGNVEGANLFRDWFAELGEAAQADRGAEYVFVMGSMAEILKVFDFPLVLPEITSLQTALRRVADEYLTVGKIMATRPTFAVTSERTLALICGKGHTPWGKSPSRPGFPRGCGEQLREFGSDDA